MEWTREMASTELAPAPHPDPEASLSALPWTLLPRQEAAALQHLAARHDVSALAWLGAVWCSLLVRYFHDQAPELVLLPGAPAPGGPGPGALPEASRRLTFRVSPWLSPLAVARSLSCDAGGASLSGEGSALLWSDAGAASSDAAAAGRPGPGQAALVLQVQSEAGSGAAGLALRILFSPIRHAARVIERLQAHLLHLLQASLREPGQALGRLPFMPQEERQALLDPLASLPVELDPADTLARLFERQVAATPGQLALEYGDQSLTYRELDAQADRLAQRLLAAHRRVRGADLAPGTPVALLFERGLARMVATLAVLKAGGAFLPLDPVQPDARLARILGEIAPPLALTERALHDRLWQAGAAAGVAPAWPAEAVLQLDPTPAEPPPPGVRLQPARPPRAGDLAYIICTSGSTGQPKGVMVEHGSVCRLARDLWARFGLAPGVRVLQFASFSFDASVYEWVGTLSAGATLVVAAPHDLPPYADITETLDRQRIHVALLFPSVLRTARDHPLPHLRLLGSAGEACTPDIVRRWAGGRTLMNLYGPTEATVACTAAVLAAGDLPHLGKAIAGHRVLVLNRWLEPLPPGVVGELCLTGPGLARGYWARPAVTAERFVALPGHLRLPATRDGERLYRTGDLARLDFGGRLEHVGRADLQVKIRGHRVELGDIEWHLAADARLRESAVAYHPATGETAARLVAYYALAPGVDLPAETLAAELDTALRRQLPPYMLPQHYVRLPCLPLTEHGKINRRALLQQDWRAALRAPPTAAATPGAEGKESLLQAVWRELLGLPEIGLDQNFYSLGGDSISVMRMVAKAEERGLRITGMQVARHPDIRSLATVAVPLQAMAGADADAHAAAAALPLGLAFELTPIQHWFFEQDFAQPAFFSQCQVVRLREPDRARLQAALGHLFLRHPALRIGFPGRGGQRRQAYLPDVEPPRLLQARLGEGLAAAEADAAAQAVYQRWLGGFDFERGKTACWGLLQGHPDGQARLFIGLHHLVCDGVSWRILLDDLERLYLGRPLAAPGTPPHLWRQALQAYAERPQTLAQLGHWHQTLEQAAGFRLPGAPGGGRQAKAELRRVRPLAEVLPRRDATAGEARMALLLCAFAQALSAWTGSSRVAFQLEGHGREACVQAAPERSVGWYTALFPFAVELGDAVTPVAAFEAVRRCWQQVPDRGLSYGVLRHCHPDPQVRAGLARPVPPVVFNFLGSFRNAPGAGGDGWRLYDENAAQDVSAPEDGLHALLEFNCSVVDEDFVCHVGYARPRLAEAEVAQLAERFLAQARALSLALASPDPAAAQGRRIVKAYPLTPLQEGMLFHQQLTPQLDTYFVQAVWRYGAVPDRHRMEQAWRRACDEVDALRTFFVWQAPARPLQYVVDHAALEWRWTDLSQLAPAEQDECIERLIDEDRATPFQLDRPGLLRLHWLQRSERCCELLWSHHHLILDGWSQPLLLARVHRLYAEGPQPGVDKEAAGFEDFVQLVQRHDGRAARRHFETRLAAAADWRTELPAGDRRQPLDPLKPVTRQAEVQLGMPAAPLLPDAPLRRVEGITPGTAVLFAFGAVLSACNEGRPCLFGTTLSGRNHDLPGLHGMVGMAINTLPVLFQPDLSADLRSHLRAMQWQISELNEHSLHPLRDIAAPSGRGPLQFNALVVFENYPGQDAVGEGDLRAELVREVEKTGYPLTVVCRLRGDSLDLRLIYDLDVFTPLAVQRIARQLRQVLLQAAHCPELPYARLQVVDGEDLAWLQQVLTGPPLQHRATRIEDVFRAQVARHPQRDAVVSHAGQRHSYRDIDQASDEVADLLRRTRCLPGELVAVAGERSAELVCALLGILKAGCAYLPLDLGSPPARNRAILQDGRIARLLALHDDAERIAGPALMETCRLGRWRLLLCATGELTAPMRPASTAPGRAGPGGAGAGEALAYVMYTSGSTGAPKGVMVPHRGVLRLVLQPNYCRLDEHTRLLQVNTPGFDASTFEIWGTLLNGGTLYPVPTEVVLDPRRLGAALREQRIDTLLLSTPLCHRLVQEDVALFAPLRQLLTGGDVLQPAVARALRAAHPGLLFVNGYGPTENTTYTSCFAVQQRHDRPVPIGRPLPGTRCLVLDEQMRPVPVGAAGELYVGGAGLALGYLNRPAETTARFLPVPTHLATADTPAGARLYCTGDQVRVLEDGSLDYLGRLDLQLKIRGHRVEPGEVEVQLAQHPAVAEAAVLWRRGDEPGSGWLLACYSTVESAAARRDADLQADFDSFLRERLPRSMQPQRYLRLPQLPRVPSGKLDRAALHALAPAADVLPADVQPAGRSEAEEVLAAVWQTCLKLERVGHEHSFFALGGDSLVAIQVASLLRQQGWQLGVSELLRGGTLPACSQLMQKIRQGSADRPAPVGWQPQAGQAYPLSPVQYRFFRRALAHPHHFLIPLAVRLAAPLTAAQLPGLLARALAGQDAHQVHFRRDPDTGALSQVWRDWEPPDYFSSVDLGGVAVEQHRDRVAEHARALQHSFDLWRGPLFRVVLFEHFEGRPTPVLYLLFHHLVADGVSMRLLLDRLREEALQPGPDTAGRPAGRTSYLQWCQQLQRHAASRDWTECRRHWAAQLGSAEHREPAVPAPRHSEMASADCLLLEGAGALQAFAEAAAAAQVSPFTVWLALFLDALREVAPDIATVHLQTAQREAGFDRLEVDLHATLGYFSAALPLQVSAAGAQAPGALLDAGRLQRLAQRLQALPEQGLDYLVLRYLLPEMDPQCPPLHDPTRVMFHYLGEDPLARSDDFYTPVDLDTGPSTDPRNVSNYLLNVTLTRRADSLAARFYYSPAHVPAAQVQRLQDRLQEAACLEVQRVSHRLYIQRPDE
ncbi:non-ribosomal peptide synthetase [Eleftheria terrae]|uniref:non-ribosomal peptide synthetase n=1 Tax=Eleftheria terrae TaxID=1597781 RepID=UPI00263AFE5F|nr:non-ribosomal peptide synthetase [Eleftheria terrae]WKB55685.1 amino acid adenylation domain-containing protein [Eleftheria terrae]